MKMILHLFYVLCLTVPVILNAGICFASYRWHVQFRLAIAKEFERLRKQR